VRSLEAARPWHRDATIFGRHWSDAGSIGDEFYRAGVSFEPSAKGDRVHGWEKLKRLMKAAGAVDEPGLFIARNCTHTWATLPTLPLD